MCSTENVQFINMLFGRDKSRLKSQVMEQYIDGDNINAVIGLIKYSGQLVLDNYLGLGLC